jgi:hypothetical protein
VNKTFRIEEWEKCLASMRDKSAIKVRRRSPQAKLRRRSYSIRLLNTLDRIVSLELLFR